MRFEHTDGCNEDFSFLCQVLDDFLNKIAGGEENRKQYIPFNIHDDIQDVILVYDEHKAIGCAGFKRYDDECAEVKGFLFVRNTGEKVFPRSL